MTRCRCSPSHGCRPRPARHAPWSGHDADPAEQHRAQQVCTHNCAVLDPCRDWARYTHHTGVAAGQLRWYGAPREDGSAPYPPSDGFPTRAGQSRSGCASIRGCFVSILIGHLAEIESGEASLRTPRTSLTVNEKSRDPVGSTRRPLISPSYPMSTLTTTPPSD